jgi:Flp pilus assembly protein TadG
MSRATLRALGTALRAFARGEQATATVEAVLFLPVLLFLYLATFVFFDAFRVNNINDKAAYTVADLLSRQTEPVNTNFINGMQRVFDFLRGNQGQSQMRVTAITYRASDDTYRVQWSRATGGLEVMTNAMLAQPSVRNRLPVMPDGESVTLVETFTRYAPLFDVGIPEQTLRTFVITRPRFAPQVLFSS